MLTESRVEARADILRIHSRSMNLTRGINLTKIAEKMNGCSGAELKGVCTEAGMFALRERRVHVTQEDFDLATAKVLNKHDDKVSFCVFFSLLFFSCCLGEWRGMITDGGTRKPHLASCGSRTGGKCICTTCMYDGVQTMSIILLWGSS